MRQQHEGKGSEKPYQILNHNTTSVVTKESQIKLVYNGKVDWLVHVDVDGFWCNELLRIRWRDWIILVLRVTKLRWLDYLFVTSRHVDIRHTNPACDIVQNETKRIVVCRKNSRQPPKLSSCRQGSNLLDCYIPTYRSVSSVMAVSLVCPSSKCVTHSTVAGSVFSLTLILKCC